MKVLFIASTGGHLSELMQLSPMFDQYDYHLITEKTKTTSDLRIKFTDRIDYLVFGTKDHFFSYLFKFSFNCLRSLYLFLKIRPKFIITTGTHTAVPICYIGKLFRSKIVYIETFANIETKTMTGKLLYPISDLFIVQWASMLSLYPKAVYKGWIY
ncbi:MAG: polysaccharide biosynthesis protein [Erysipelotrichaceae bacterium]|nr:polysaccharide biosynthesis protein [Erysipelotrichaceae bacterium]MDD3923884.1 polysaccharide biosynthesis protein [Erysipelotrichaceae bacterium]MDD4642015.1 polysaccharide biosynthesis protein [Erysipelotrichaceae bacterium]